MSAAGASLGIGEVARRSGIPASALRYYESIGLLPAPERVSGRRRYDSSVLDVLVVVDTARRAGFSLAEVKQLLAGVGDDASVGPGATWHELASRKVVEIDALIEQFVAMRGLLQQLAGCECVDLAACAAALRAPR